MSFKNRRLLFYMEVRYRFVKLYKKRVDEMLLKGVSLNNQEMIKWQIRYENQLIKLYRNKERFESDTDQKVIFYNMFNDMK